MKWETNKSLDEDIKNVSSLIDKDKLIARICYILNISEKDLFNNVTEELLESLISCVLVNRNINDKDKINALFNNIDISITDPFDLVNAKKAADLITVFLKNKNTKIYIFADYDCDGACSGYVLTDVLRKLTDNEVIIYYPERSEGYGINIEFCKSVISDTSVDNKDKLVITVDNGITKKDEVKLLKDNNIEVIISDHHTSKAEEVPDCLIVNPHNSCIEQDDTFKHLCGTGVAFKIAQLIQDNFGVYEMYNYTPYLALSTLSDVMPLVDENVALIQYGLEIMNSNECPLGIKELKKQTNIDIITTKDILWSIAPMINACGRMGNTALASKLFFVNEDTIKQDVKDIINLNESRKTETKNAKADIAKMNFDDCTVCIIPTDKYTKGILGIIAGKAVEMFNKPAIVASLTSDGHYHGSIRSINGINMFELCKQMKDLDIIVDYGGHAEACVCTFDIDRLDDMKNFFNENITVTEKTSEETAEEEVLKIDEIISLDYLTKVIYAIVNLFPCDGKAFKNPTFALTDLKVIGYSLSKKNPENIKFTVRQGRKKQDIWAWGFGSKYIEELQCPSTIHIAGEITKSFTGSYSLNVIDIMTA
jgi:single-stranded-DNA-specific exonuclease